MGTANILFWPRDMLEICTRIAKEQAVLKIVAKMKNETYFAEKWILHHLNIVRDAKLIIFDNMSTDPLVLEVYEKYKNNIILVQFDRYMDCLHMSNKFMMLYKALSISSKYFTLIDADEFLCLYDGQRLLADPSLVSFLRKNDGINFFPTLWLDNVSSQETVFNFVPDRIWSVHMGKPIIGSNLLSEIQDEVDENDNLILHHIKDLPLATYGRAPLGFVLLHLKNANAYNRIESNMKKLTAFHVVNHPKDFKSLITADLDAFEIPFVKSYVVETRRLIEEALEDDSGQGRETNTIERQGDGSLTFTPRRLKLDFDSMMQSDYFELFGYRPDMNKEKKYLKIVDFLQRPKG